MSTTEVPSNATSDASVGRVDMKLEAVVIPVSDVDRAKEFYEGLGWRLDADFAFDNGFRVVQFTPPGLGVLGPVRHEHHFGRARLGPGPVPDRLRHRGRHDDLVAHGVDASEVFHAGARALSSSPTARAVGRAGPRPITPATARSPTFSDPDGNGWLLQEITNRLPGRVDAADDGVRSAADLASALGVRRPPTASTRSAPGERDENWPDWYAAYMVAEQAGDELPS